MEEDRVDWTEEAEALLRAFSGQLPDELLRVRETEGSTQEARQLPTLMDGQAMTDGRVLASRQAEQRHMDAIRALEVETLEEEEDDDFDEEEESDDDDDDSLRDRGGFTFDATITSLHSYLGEIDDVSGGRSFVEGGQNLVLSVFYLEGIVLFPEQTLPLRVMQPRFKAAVVRAMSQTVAARTLGVILVEHSRHGHHPAMVGTTAEIRKLRNMPDGSISLVTKGRQRFVVQRAFIQADGSPCAEVQIIREEEILQIPRAAFAELASKPRVRTSSTLERVKTNKALEQARPAWSLSHHVPSLAVAQTEADRRRSRVWSERVWEPQAVDGETTSTLGGVSEVYDDGGQLPPRQRSRGSRSELDFIPQLALERIQDDMEVDVGEGRGADVPQESMEHNERIRSNETDDSAHAWWWRFPVREGGGGGWLSSPLQDLAQDRGGIQVHGEVGDTGLAASEALDDHASRPRHVDGENNLLLSGTRGDSVGEVAEGTGGNPRVRNADPREAVPLMDSERERTQGCANDLEEGGAQCCVVDTLQEGASSRHHLSGEDLQGSLPDGTQTSEDNLASHYARRGMNFLSSEGQTSDIQLQSRIRDNLPSTEAESSGDDLRADTPPVQDENTGEVGLDDMGNNLQSRFVPESNSEQGESERSLGATVGGEEDLMDRTEDYSMEDARHLWRLNEKQWSCRAQLSHWPHWVYRMYDATDLARRLADMFRQIYPGRAVENLAASPEALSYFVGSHLPVSDSLRQQLLEERTTVERLRRELSLLQLLDDLCCSKCMVLVAHRSDVVTMSSDGPICAFVNAHGFIHDTITLRRAEGLLLEGTPETENSWFPGFAWTIALCAECGHHLGWRFTATKRRLQPQEFWGLRRSHLSSEVLNERENRHRRPWEY